MGTFWSISSTKIYIFRNRFHFQSKFFKAVLLRYQTLNSYFSDFFHPRVPPSVFENFDQNVKSFISVRKKIKTDLKSVGKTFSFDNDFFGNYPNIQVLNSCFLIPLNTGGMRPPPPIMRPEFPSFLSLDKGGVSALNPQSKFQTQLTMYCS